MVLCNASQSNANITMALTANFCTLLLYCFMVLGHTIKQGEARRGEARRGEARPGEARPGQARRGEARRGEARQGGKARQGKARQECRRDTQSLEQVFDMLN